MGYVNIATTTTLAKAVAKTNSNSDLLVFPNDQPHAIVRNGKVIGTTYKKVDSGSILSCLHHINYIKLTQDTTLDYDGVLFDGVVYHVIIENPTTTKIYVDFDVDSMSASTGVSNIVYDGNSYGQGDVLTLGVNGYAGLFLAMIVISTDYGRTLYIK